MYDRMDSFCILRVYSIGSSIMKVYVDRVPFALPYIISKRDWWSATISPISFELLPFLLVLSFETYIHAVKTRRMTFTLWDGKVSLINLFPSMPLGSRAQTLDSKGAAVHPSYLLPELLLRGLMSDLLSWAWPLESQGHICLQNWLFCDTDTQGLSSPWSSANLPRPYIRGRRREELPAEESELWMHSTRVSCHCLLLPLCPRCRVDVPFATLHFPVNV